MDKQVWLFRLLNSASLSNLESVEILLHHLASLAAPTHYVALQVDHCQLELEMIWWKNFRQRNRWCHLFPTQTTLMRNCSKERFTRRVDEDVTMHNFTIIRFWCVIERFFFIKCLTDHQKGISLWRVAQGDGGGGPRLLASQGANYGGDMIMCTITWLKISQP